MLTSPRKRQFASGSRAAHDPLDRFLEEINYYRKHSPRDKSSLFRAVSEQLYGSQEYHALVREICVQYMREHIDEIKINFRKDINLSKYIDNLAKSYTSGTLFELNIIAEIYCKSIYLFEPYESGKWFFHHPESTGTLRLFLTPEKYFDTVYEMEFVEIVGFCQAICYEILYKDVFRLPDVSYAVEVMLHSPDGVYHTDKDENYEYASQIYLPDSTNFILDKPDNTSCILDDASLCHFHNENFTDFISQLEEKMTALTEPVNPVDPLLRTFDSLLPEKYISCVRQLLHVGITPFPYKVAKALDENIYRNVDFDAWNETRKISRLYNTKISGYYHMGEKCLVRIDCDDEPYVCYIQEFDQATNTCLVYIEELGEKRRVHLRSLRQMRHDMNRSYNVISNGNVKNSKISYGKKNSEKSNYYRENCLMKSLIHPSNIAPIPCNYVAMPVLKETSNKFVINAIPPYVAKPNQISNLLSGDDKSDKTSEKYNPERSNDRSGQSVEQISDEGIVVSGDNFFTGMNSDYGSADPGTMQSDEGQSFNYGMPNVWHQTDNNGIPYITTCPPPPPPIQFGIINRIDLLRTNQPINLEAAPSYSPNASDLPLNDLATIRFFYNLGHDYFGQLHHVYGPEFTKSLVQDNTVQSSEMASGMNYSGYKQNNHKKDKDDRGDFRKKNGNRNNKQRQHNVEMKDGFHKGKKHNSGYSEKEPNCSYNEQDKGNSAMHKSKDQSTPTGILTGKRNSKQMRTNHRHDSKDSSILSDLSENLASSVSLNKGGDTLPEPGEYAVGQYYYPTPYYYQMDNQVNDAVYPGAQINYPYTNYAVQGYSYAPTQQILPQYPNVNHHHGYMEGPGVMHPGEVQYETAGYPSYPQVMLIPPVQPMMANYWMPPPVMPQPIADAQYTMQQPASNMQLKPVSYNTTK